MRTCRPPAREPMTVRSARAVRPPLPMTFPRSSGCTRTSRTLPRRSMRLATRTSSSCSTIPLTRCSRASSSTSGLATTVAGSCLSGLRLSRRGLGGRGLGGLGLRGLGLVSLRLVSLRLVSLGLGSLGLGGRGLSRRGVLLRPRGGPRRLGVLLGLLGLLGREALLHQFLVARLLVGLRLGDLEGGRGTGLALELLPVARDGEQLTDGVGRQRADRQPVLGALGVHLDERRVLFRVVLADLLDGAPVPLGACVGNDDPVLRVP